MKKIFVFLTNAIICPILFISCSTTNEVKTAVDNKPATTISVDAIIDAKNIRSNDVEEKMYIYYNTDFASDESKDDFETIQDDLLYYLSSAERKLKEMKVELREKRLDKNISMLFVKGDKTKEAHSVLESQEIFRLLSDVFGVK